MSPVYYRGLAASWDKDLNGNRFSKQTFDRSVRLFDAGLLRVPLLLDHDFGQVVGEVLELRAGEDGIEITAIQQASEVQFERIAAMAVAPTPSGDDA